MRVGVDEPREIVHRLKPDPSELHDARRIAREAAGGLMSRERCGQLDMAVTETVSNAIRHSGSSADIVMTLTPKDGYLCVRVTDDGDGLVPRPGAIATEPGAGYGLFLVEQLTRRWGVTRENDKTRVWFEIDYDSAA